MTIASFPKGTRTDVSLAPFTTWRAGGAAAYFWEPDRLDEVPDVVRACRSAGLPYVCIGRGSNLLVPDEGYPGLVICTRKASRDIRRSGNTIVASAGVPLPLLAKTAARAGVGGFAFLIGIPGTVGGGVVINAGLLAHATQDIAGILESALVVQPDGRVERLSCEAMQFGNRTSVLEGTEAVVVEAEFAFVHPANPADIQRETREHLVERKRKQPLNQHTAGSTFKHPGTGRSAGWYLDRAGLKGASVGDARVSTLHANWIENHGGSATDIVSLMRHMQEEVHRQFNVVLLPEVQVIGGADVSAGAILQ